MLFDLGIHRAKIYRFTSNPFFPLSLSLSLRLLGITILSAYVVFSADLWRTALLQMMRLCRQFFFAPLFIIQAVERTSPLFYFPFHLFFVFPQWSTYHWRLSINKRLFCEYPAGRSSFFLSISIFSLCSKLHTMVNTERPGYNGPIASLYLFVCLLFITLGGSSRQLVVFVVFVLSRWWIRRNTQSSLCSVALFLWLLNFVQNIDSLEELT